MPRPAGEPRADQSASKGLTKLPPIRVKSAVLRATTLSCLNSATAAISMSSACAGRGTCSPPRLGGIRVEGQQCQAWPAVGRRLQVTRLGHQLPFGSADRKAASGTGSYRSLCLRLCPLIRLLQRRTAPTADTRPFCRRAEATNVVVDSPYAAMLPQRCNPAGGLCATTRVALVAPIPSRGGLLHLARRAVSMVTARWCRRKGKVGVVSRELELTLDDRRGCLCQYTPLRSRRGDGVGVGARGRPAACGDLAAPARRKLSPQPTLETHP